MKDFLRELFGDITEEQEKAGEIIRDICVSNHTNLPEMIITLNYFSGIDPVNIIEKVNPINTPLIESAMHLYH